MTSVPCVCATLGVHEWVRSRVNPQSVPLYGSQSGPIYGSTRTFPLTRLSGQNDPRAELGFSGLAPGGLESLSAPAQHGKVASRSAERHLRRHAGLHS